MIRLSGKSESDEMWDGAVGALYTGIGLLFFAVVVGGEWLFASCGFIIILLSFSFFFEWYRLSTPARERKAILKNQKKENLEAKKAQFSKWALEWYREEVPSRAKIEDHLLYPLWKEYLAEEKRKLEEEKMARAREERERKWKLQQEEAERRKRAERRARDAKENEEKLKKAINALEQKEVHKMAELVSKYSKKSLNNVTSGYRGIRKSGTIDQIKKSLIERVDDWVNQIMEIERLNASISRNATIEELVSIEEIILE